MQMVGIHSADAVGTAHDTVGQRSCSHLAGRMAYKGAVLLDKHRILGFINYISGCCCMKPKMI